MCAERLAHHLAHDQDGREQDRDSVQERGELYDCLQWLLDKEDYNGGEERLLRGLQRHGVDGAVSIICGSIVYCGAYNVMVLMEQ